MEDSKKIKIYERSWFIWLMLIFIAPVGIFLIWKNKKYNKAVRVILSIMFSFIFLIFLSVSFSGNDTNENTANNTNSNSTNVQKTVQVSSAAKKEEKKASNAKLYKEILPSINDSRSSKLQQKSYDFLANNNGLFPAQSVDDRNKLNQMVDRSIEYKHLDKNINDCLEKVISINGSVVSINEENYENNTISIIHILNDNEESFQVIYHGKLDVFKEDSVRCVGLPVAMNSFANVSGGTTNVAIIIGGYIQKN